MNKAGTLLQCLQRCRGSGAVQSRLFSAGSGPGSPDDPLVEPESNYSSSMAPSIGDWSDVVGTQGATDDEHESSRGRWWAKQHNAPLRKHMYHRRHREQKKLEKRQDRLLHLQGIHEEAHARGDNRMSEAAGGEAERLQRPWLQRNVPVKPPAYASVSGGMPKQAKVVAYTGDGLPRDDSLGLATETRSMDVLNFKVGYAIDAQYALPEEVQAFVLDQTTFCLYGVDKNQVTQIASNIRRIRPPEPYKGAGIRIVGETVKLKERRVK